MGTRLSTQMEPNQNRFLNNVILSLITAIVTAGIGSVGIAAAQSPTTNDNSPSFVTFCKQNYKKLGYSNLGQCVSHHNGHGHGYGGDNDNDGDDHGNHHHHFHFHNFFGGWWHHIEHHF